MALSENSTCWAVILIALCLLCTVTAALRRLYISPLAQFPGPKLAALTSWYEFYFDCIRRGRFTWHIKTLHDRYGPLVRITPYELHVNDPFMSDELFSFRAKLDRYESATQQFGMDDATVFTVPHVQHRLRRSALAPFFARTAVSTPPNSSLIGDKVDKICSRIEQVRGTGIPLNLDLAFKCLATDVISGYALGTPSNMLDTPDFNAEWFKAQRATGEAVLFAKHFPRLIPLLRRLPSWLITFLSPEMGKSLAKGEAIKEQVSEIVRERSEDTEYKKNLTLFHHLLQSSLPLQEKSVGHLSREGIVVLGAGSDTTGIALTVIAFHVLDNATVLLTLRKELVENLSDPQARPTLDQLEKLPYLSAIIKEGLRLAHGTSNRLPRVSRVSVQYGRWTIPPKTPVSMSPMLVHENETIFPSHSEFRPQRWLEPDGKHLEKYLMTFGKGPRSCLGIHLAYAELYVTLATIFRRYDLELFHTVRKDVDAEHDFMVPCARLDSQGVRVLVNG